MRGMGAAGREWERGERAGARELLQPWAGKGFNQGWPCLEYGYSFKTRVTFPEDGWEQGRGLGKVSPKQGACGRAEGDTKTLLGMSRSSKYLGQKHCCYSGAEVSKCQPKIVQTFPRGRAKK